MTVKTATPAKTARSTRKATPAKKTPARPTGKPAEAPAAKPAPANCGCGCGAPTITAKAVFLSGHDARHAGVIGRALAANPTDEAALASLARMSPVLQAKTNAITKTALAKVAKKAAAAKAKEAAKAAYDKALADALA